MSSLEAGIRRIVEKHVFSDPLVQMDQATRESLVTDLADYVRGNKEPGIFRVEL